MIKDKTKGVSVKLILKQYQSNADMIGMIEGLNNQLKSIAKIITEIYSSDDKSVSSQKKEWIMKILNFKEYKEQQKKVELMLKTAQQYYYAETVEHTENEDELMEIDGIQVWAALFKRGIKQQDSKLNSKK